MTQSHDQNYKDLFARNLAPFLDMLSNQKQDIDNEQWIELVGRIESRVIVNPEQYIGKEFPDEKLTTKIIEAIFDDFLQAHSIEENRLIFGS